MLSTQSEGTLVGAQFGLDLSVVLRVVCTVTNEIIGMILWITGHT
jgi:hypothetical protein